MENQFDDLRPYYDSEIPDAMKRIADDASFVQVSHFLYPGVPVEQMQYAIRAIQTIDQLQSRIMQPIVQRIVASTMTAFTFDGIEHVTRKQSMLFVSNHRDIVMDSFLHQYMLFLNSIPTAQITFGSNLMISPFIIDIGKSNKMFKVIRKGDDMREFLRNSRHLSDYIRHTLVQHNESVWIAQRNGRTKNGIDATDQGLLKMFGMSGSKDLVASFAALNIAPVSISYEWEPCDFLKTKELYAVKMLKGAKYVKEKNEDLNSILVGITQPKGRVHVAVCPRITVQDLQEIWDTKGASEFHNGLAGLIDRRIQAAYQLYPNNYIARDMMEGTRRYASHYSPQEEDMFLKRLELLPCTVEGDPDEIKAIFLGIYGNPVPHTPQ